MDSLTLKPVEHIPSVSETMHVLYTLSMSPLFTGRQLKANQ